MIVAGFGFRGAATVDSLRSAYAIAAGDHLVTALATAEDKAVAPSLTALAAQLGLPIHGIQQEVLTAQPSDTQSPKSLAARATGSVAEAAALAAVGPGARLLTARVVSDDHLATCALAIGETE